MTYCCNRRHIVNHHIFTGESLGQKSLKASVAKAVVVPVNIIPSHLVNHYTNNEFGAADHCTWRINSNIFLLAETGQNTNYQREKKDGSFDFHFIIQIFI